MTKQSHSLSRFWKAVNFCNAGRKASVLQIYINFSTYLPDQAYIAHVIINFIFIIFHYDPVSIYSLACI
jgi:hypothetical protein